MTGKAVGKFGMNKKKLFWMWAPWVLWAIAVVAFSTYLAYERVVVCSYSSINGDFQSYNVFRRMMDGQIPYVDFSNYIGMAPVYLNYPFVKLLGGSFRDSLFVTNFTAHILFCVCAFLVLWMTSGSRNISLLLSCTMAKIVSTQIHYQILGPKYGWIFNERFTGIYTPSNSMRIARCFLPFLLVGVTVLFLRVCCRNKSENALLHLGEKPQGNICFGFILGLAITWGGEYGLACIAVVMIILIFLHIAEYRLRLIKALWNFTAFFIALAIGALLSMTLVTAGHPAAWMRSFLATGEYQSFYFSGLVRETVVEDLVMNRDFWISAVPFVVCLLWLTIRLFQRKMTDNQLMLYFLVAAVLAGTVAYILTGSGFSCREPLQVFTLIALLGWTIGLIRRWNGWRCWCKWIRCAQLLMMVFVAAYLGMQGSAAAAGKTDTPVSGQYVPALEGYADVYDALITADEITGDDLVFSVYATGLETVKNQFQPTGYDYIIHALGEDAQDHYVRTFRDGAYRWVQTPRMAVDGWLAMENWYFYREIYRNYQKKYETEYSWLWEYTGDQTLDASVAIDITYEDDGSVVVDLTADKTDTFIADVYLSYETQFKNVGAMLLGLGRENVKITSLGVYPEEELTYNCQNLGGDSETYFPVVMKNGKGKIVLRGFDVDGLCVMNVSAEFCTALPRYSLFEASCE